MSHYTCTNVQRALSLCQSIMWPSQAEMPACMRHAKPPWDCIGSLCKCITECGGSLQGASISSSTALRVVHWYCCVDEATASACISRACGNQGHSICCGLRSPRLGFHAVLYTAVGMEGCAVLPMAEGSWAQHTPIMHRCSASYE